MTIFEIASAETSKRDPGNKLQWRYRAFKIGMPTLWLMYWMEKIKRIWHDLIWVGMRIWFFQNFEFSSAIFKNSKLFLFGENSAIDSSRRVRIANGITFCLTPSIHRDTASQSEGNMGKSSKIPEILRAYMPKYKYNCINMSKFFVQLFGDFPTS